MSTIRTIQFWACLIIANIHFARAESNTYITGSLGFVWLAILGLIVYLNYRDSKNV